MSDDYGDLQNPGGGYGASRVAGTNYASKGGKPKKSATKPSCLLDAKKALGRLPETIDLSVVVWVKDEPQTRSTPVSLKTVKKSVQFLESSRYPRKKIREFLRKGEWSAWTQSDSKVYLSPKTKGKTPEFFDAIVAHEVLHCIQFAKNGGSPPKTIEEMCEFEYATYGDTAGFLPDSNSWKQGMQEASDLFKEKLQDVRGISAAKRNAELRKWMEVAKYLPKNAGPVSQLY